MKYKVHLKHVHCIEVSDKSYATQISFGFLNIVCMAVGVVRRRKIRFLPEKAANSIAGVMLNEFKRKNKVGREGVGRKTPPPPHPLKLLLNSFNMAPEVEFATFSARNEIFRLLIRPLATQAI